MDFRFKEGSRDGFEALGYTGHLVWDRVQPIRGFSPVRRVQYPESVWNPAHWPLSKENPMRLLKKGKVKELFLLETWDIVDLGYIPDRINDYTAKMYRYKQVERRAWEKYGGPTGLGAALDLRYGSESVALHPVSAIRKSCARSPISRKSQYSTPSTLLPPTPLTRPGFSKPASPISPKRCWPSSAAPVRSTQPKIGNSGEDNESDNDDGRKSPVFFGDLLSPSIMNKSTPATHSGRPSSSPVKRLPENEPEPLTPPRSIRQKVYHKESTDDDNECESDSDDEPPAPTPMSRSSSVKRKVAQRATHLSSPSKGKSAHTVALSRQTGGDLSEDSEEECCAMKSLVHEISKSVSPKKGAVEITMNIKIRYVD
ncbi:hypothetical protein M413DRAFT_444776 [Hebeloma cylindrosporum]|uniref:Uncharacterized protein n=1 Tax=Hebeloma cylindrosporum TaxID=76867 RepID=A0A0C2YMV1_HEBCY|nr:hypothetical protein M413DRAFT_444776 [Hebeloma cylindrosporum h7]